MKIRKWVLQDENGRLLSYIKKGAFDRVSWSRVDGIHFETKVGALEEPTEAYLLTDENFGCVLYVPKEGKEV
jgi:hypothetical protein